MSSISSSSSFLALTSSLHISRQCCSLQPTRSCYQRYAFNGHGNITLSVHVQSKSNLQSDCSAIASSNDGMVSVINFKDVMEKDWSFLEYLDSSEEQKQNIDEIIAAGKITETSKHASRKTMTKFKCWQGELIYVPEKWTPFDVVFLCFLPALPFELGQILEALRKRGLAGARIVISHPQGRQVGEEQQKQYPDVVVSNLPEKMLLQNVAADHSFEVAKFVDEPSFYLAILKLEAESMNK